MSRVKDGDTVRVHYTGKLEDGQIFDSSRERQPIEFMVGSGNIIPGIEEAVISMESGDTKTIEIPSEEAFGPRQEELVVEIEKSKLPDHITPAMGQTLRMQHGNGTHTDLMIVDVSEERITLDGNHPLAGHKLIFDLELVDIA
jgi:peptidylprolyl isomerase